MFTQNVIFLFLYLYQNRLEAAIPIQIITEKTNLENLPPEFPFIIAMIPEKEPLISARKKITDEKHLNNSQEQRLGERIKFSHENLSEIEPTKNVVTTLLPTGITQSYSAIYNLAPEKTEVSKVFSKQLTSSWHDLSKKQPLLIKNIASKESTLSQRRKRSLQDMIKPKAQVKPNDLLTELQEPKENLLEVEGEETAEEGILQRKRNEMRLNANRDFYHYDSGYVDYIVPFPYYKRPWSEPVSVGHGVGIATAQLYPIIKSMLLGRSSLTGKRHNYRGRPSWKKPWFPKGYV